MEEKRYNLIQNNQLGGKRGPRKIRSSKRKNNRPYRLGAQRKKDSNSYLRELGSTKRLGSQGQMCRGHEGKVGNIWYEYHEK